MTMLQHYYTSCEKGTSGGAGFQCKAMSPGISSQDLQTLNRTLGYRIPPSLDEYEIAQHPVALRYDYFDSEKCYLICSQSNGTDENGRPGNFFAHSVITNPSDFDIYPPIMYWRHPFWQRQDSSDSLEIPEKESFNLEPSLEFEQIWPFLDEGKRREWFKKLLAAVINYDKSKRPIVILDHVDNVALWIAMVTFALPKIYRRFLTFSTYHHDPYHVSFHITGTTSDSKFRFSSDEYISYFILNAETNQISSIENSEYADFVVTNFTPDLYETKLLAFFDLCNNRLPERRVTNLDAILGSATNFYLIVREGELPLRSTKTQRSIQSFLDYVERLRDISFGDLDDLIATTNTIEEALATSSKLNLSQEYRRALHLLKKHDPKFLQRCKHNVYLLAKFILAGDTPKSQKLYEIYEKVYPKEQLIQSASQSDFIAMLTSKLPNNRLNVYQSVWAYLVVPLFRFDTQNRPKLQLLLQKTLLALDSHSTTNQLSPSADVAKLLTMIIKATRSHQQFLLNSMVEWKTKTSGPAFKWLYYELVKGIPLSQRQAYRKQISSVAPKIIYYELQRDINAADNKNWIPLLKDWIEHTENAKPIQENVVPQSLKIMWGQLETRQRTIFSRAVLVSPSITDRLDQQWTAKLLNSFFTNLRLEKLDAGTIKLYETYFDHPNLSLEQQAIIGGSLALSTKQFYRRSVSQIQSWLSRVDENTYTSEAKKFMSTFFKPELSIETHIEMLQAIYVQHHSSIFWELYWMHLKDLLLEQNRVDDFVTLMSFWFDESLPVFDEIPYLGPSFFLQLPPILTEINAMKKFKRIKAQIKRQANRASWYPLIAPYLPDKKTKGFLGHLRTKR